MRFRQRILEGSFHVVLNDNCANLCSYKQFNSPSHLNRDYIMHLHEEDEASFSEHSMISHVDPFILSYRNVFFVWAPASYIDMQPFVKQNYNSIAFTNLKLTSKCFCSVSKANQMVRLGRRFAAALPHDSYRSSAAALAHTRK